MRPSRFAAEFLQPVHDRGGMVKGYLEYDFMGNYDRTSLAHLKSKLQTPQQMMQESSAMPLMKRPTSIVIGARRNSAGRYISCCSALSAASLF